jgi:hypothetical protein
MHYGNITNNQKIIYIIAKLSHPKPTNKSTAVIHTQQQKQ